VGLRGEESDGRLLLGCWGNSIWNYLFDGMGVGVSQVSIGRGKLKNKIMKKGVDEKELGSMKAVSSLFFFDRRFVNASRFFWF
jgi:hypothetical protein